MNNLNPSRKLAARPHVGLFSVLMLLAGWLAVVTPLRADNPPTYWFEIDFSALSGGFGPTFLALDSATNVYASGLSIGQIVKFSRDGVYLTQWVSEDHSGIAVDSSNNVYVADTDNHLVNKFTSSGNYLTQWGSHGSGNGQFVNPWGIAVDSSNNVYVVDAGNHRVEKFTSSGIYLMQWGSSGTNHGQFAGPLGIAVDNSNNVYVTDNENNRVEKFDSGGNYLTQWGNSGSGNGQFDYPSGIAVDSSNNVYVADTDNNRVEKFDRGGNYLTQWGSGGSGNGQFLEPWGIAVDGSGNVIYVADGNRIEVFVNNTDIGAPYITSQPTNQIVAVGANVTFSAGVIGTPPFAYQWNSNNVALAGATNATFTLTDVSLSDSANYTVLVTNNFGGQLSSNAVLAIFPAFELNPPTYLLEIDSSAAPEGFQPLFLALDSSDNVYVTDNARYRIEKFTSGGNYLTQWGGCCSGNGAFYDPKGIAVDSGNNVYVADSGNNRIEKFDSNGNYLMPWGSFGTNNSQFNSPEGIGVDSDNNIYVVDSSNNRVEKFDSSGNYLTQWGGSGSGHGQFNWPEGIALDSSNNVYVADTDNHRVEKFTSNGAYLMQWGGSGSGHGQFDGPEGIAVDSSNHVYVTDNGNERVEKFTSSGIYLTQWGSSGNGNGQFGNAYGIAVDRSANVIYVADAGYSRIEVFVNNPNVVPPIFTNQPVNQTVPAGSDVTFSVGVVGTAPFSYQWSFNNVILPGATNANLMLTNVSLSASGAYSAVVNNDSSSELSSAAVLTVLPESEYIAPTYLYEIDYAGVPGGFSPNCMALDSSNNVYVTDSLNNRVDKFTGRGTYLTQWGSAGSGNGQFSNPYGIAVDGSNNVYVSDDFNDRVEKFTSSGNYLTQWGPLGTNNNRPNYSQAIAVDSSNNIYVCDDGNNRIEKFDSSGNYLTQWGSLGSGLGQFQQPGAVGVDSSNNVYVADANNYRIEKFDSNGNYLTQWGSNGTNNGQFSNPQGVAVDGSNNVYVTDYGNNRIEKFASNGAYLTQWGNYGTNHGQFNHPAGIAVDSSGNVIYVSDYGNSRIQVFVNNANILPPIIAQQPTNQTVPAGFSVTFSVGTIGTAPFFYQWIANNVTVPGATNATLTLTNVSLSASGSTYSVLVTNDFGSDLSGSALLTVLPAADYLAPTYLYQMDSAALPGGIAYLSSVALDRSNSVYVADFNDEIVKLTAGGSYLTQWGNYGGGDGQFEFPEGIAVDGSNNVYVADNYNDRIEKFSSSGAYLTQWGNAGGGSGQFEYPQGVAVDSNNNVYVADTDNGRIQKFSSNGTYLTQWGGAGSGDGQFELPKGIAVDRSNNVYVADTDNNRIQKFDNSGTYVTQWGSYGTNNGQFANPEGIAVDSDDNIYVADTGNSRIEKFTSTGAYLAQWGGPGRGNGQLENPQGVAVDSTGNYIYVADSGNYRVQVFVNDVNIVPPIIAQPPMNQTVPVGFNVTFSVGVAGTAPFSYQWNFNNVAVAGATNATFTLTNVSLSDSGATSSVQVTNGYGNTASGNAVLTVLPALVTTQPASGLSATGAVLSGSVTIGPNETVVWFDWGTETNYGNITGAITVPGNNGSNTISAPVNGLPGNTYHYRMDAANDFGIVYGEDQGFTVGFAPSVTTLPPTNAANGAILDALVNPEGWDTTVYFHWGTATLTNTTLGMDIGAGAMALNVSGFVPGLLSSTPYQYQVVASNMLGTAVGNIVFGDPSHQHYFTSGSKLNITLSPGTYIITAYGAAGGYGNVYGSGPFGAAYSSSPGGLGAEMSAKFNFSTATNLTLLVGGRGYANAYGGGGGGGGSFVVQGSTPLVAAGGGGGGADYLGYVGNGSVSTNGGSGGGYYSTPGEYDSDATGGPGGTDGGGGGIGSVGGNNIGGGGGGGGFWGDGVGGGLSFEDGGYGGGGYGGGAAGGEGAPGGGGGFSGGGGGGYYDVWGGLAGGGYYVDYESGYGGGGGSIIDSSAITNFAEVSGILSPDDPNNGEIIITAVPTPLVIATHAAFGFTNGVFGFDVAGPSGSNVVIQVSTDLQTWIPLETNLLGDGPIYFSDSQSATNTRRFYRVQSSP